MFKKPFRIKSQSVMKGSDRKKLRAELDRNFSDLGADACSDIIPNKEEVTVVKIYTNAGDNAFIYCVNKIPLLFEVDKQKVLYPSVYLLWRYPDLVYKFTTWPPVFKKLTEGAGDLFKSIKSGLGWVTELICTEVHTQLSFIIQNFRERERAKWEALQVTILLKDHRQADLKLRKIEESPWNDLMLPGVIVRGEMSPSTFKGVEKGQTCCVSVLGNRAPVVVGHTLMSGSDMFDSGMKGKGIHAIHFLGDELWLFGDKSKPPDLGDDPLPPELAEEFEDEVDSTNSVKDEVNEGAEGKNGDVESEGAVGGVEESAVLNNLEGLNIEEKVPDDSCGEHLAEESPEQFDQSEARDESHGQLGQSDVLQDQVDQSEGKDQPGDTEDAPVTTEEMDARLEFCFRCAIKSSVKKNDLPLLTSAFYRAHMMKYCEAGKQVDIKKSSYKKLSKFLKKQEKTGIIKVKELSKGVDSIVEMDKSHEDLRGLEVPEVVEEQPLPSSSSQKYTPPVITEMFGITANVLPLFKGLGYSKGDALKSSDIRKIVTDYVKATDLQQEDSKSEVVLDPVLAEILLHKSEGDRATLKWDDVFSRLLGKMSSVCEFKFEGERPILKKGNIEPIRIDVVQRASNKKVTVIENLEQFGIDPKEFGHTVQVRVACSASVTPSQQKNKGPQVIIQGNQISCVGDLLLSTYKVPRKYIQGLEKAPKSKRR